jgi:GxxExxY protein
MNTDEHRWRTTMTEEELNSLTEKIIGCAFKVSNTLGCGFLEKVYENALGHELRKNGFKAEPQHPINIYYDGVLVGEYFVDILVNDTVLLYTFPLTVLLSITRRVERHSRAGSRHDPYPVVASRG